MYVNKAIVIGNLTRDPEAKALPSGIAVTQMTMAVDRTFKDRNGERKKEVDYINVVLFGKQAEVTAQYLKKGQNAYVEGRIQTRSWEDRDGKKQYRTEVVAEKIQFGPKPAGQAQQAATPALTPTEPSKDMDIPEGEINPEDVPF